MARDPGSRKNALTALKQARTALLLEVEQALTEPIFDGLHGVTVKSRLQAAAEEVRRCESWLEIYTT